MINPIYKFEIEVTHSGSETITRRVYPVYGEGLTKEWTQESGERFFRETLSGELNFSGADYDFLIGYPFGREFRLTVYYSDDMGAGGRAIGGADSPSRTAPLMRMTGR